MAETPVSFRARDGVILEGLWDPEGSKGVVILLHPHPLYGGQMRNHVLKVLREAALQEGFSTLRFNFRGVGRSEGAYGEGVKEREDLRGALDFVAAGGPNGPIIVAGYSFGSMVAARVAPEDERIQGLALISPPLSMEDFSVLKGYAKPKFVAAGDRDFVCPLEQLREFFDSLPDPKMLKVIEGCDHFYSWGMHVALREPFKEFLRTHFG